MPDTSYLKMIDIWLFFNLLVPFVLIIIHTFMETLRLKFLENLFFGRRKKENPIRNREEEEQLELR